MTSIASDRIAIVGAGAFGTLLAARMHESGAPVTLVAHRHADATEITVDGITIIDSRGERTVRVPCISFGASPAGFFTLVFCVKSYDTRSAAEMHCPRLATGGFVLTLQNGAGNVEALAEVFGRENVVAGISTEAALLERVGRVRHTGRGETHVGELDGAISPRLKRLAAILDRAGYRTRLAKSVDRLIWRKLAINAGINALTAIAGQPNGWISQNPHARSLAIAAVREVCAVSEYAGCALDADELAGVMLGVAQRTAKNRSSMLIDIERGRATEVEAIQGYVVRMGARFDVPTPVNSVLRDLVLSISTARPDEFPHGGSTS
ncbi:MAG: ketopantoate reductase family protein [Deltaproteobacteria bacterium]|nr:ketopantoate reductase family protein [Deltaproteobacteria bacterium]